MLVLSRRVHEKVLFPTLGVTVQVVSVKGGVVRLGIEAPPDVKILRAEVQERQAEWEQTPEPCSASAASGSISGLVRKRLDVARIGLAEAHAQLAAGNSIDLRVTLEKLDEDLLMLQERLARGERPEALRQAEPCGLKALLVEDNANERQLLATFLRNAGLEVATAGNGCDALDILHNRERPDVVLLDMGLPRCDGATMVRAVRQDPAYAGLKIFAVTGHDPQEYDLAQGPAGVDRWFQKPIDPADLVLGMAQELNQDLCCR